LGVVTRVAKHAIRDKFVAEIETAKAKLETLKAEAETAIAEFEIKAITELITKRHEILQKLRQTKKDPRLKQPRRGGNDSWQGLSDHFRPRGISPSRLRKKCLLLQGRGYT